MSITVEEVSINAAAEALNYSADIIAHLVRQGVITGQGGVCDLESATEIVEELRAARAPVEGEGILATDAAKKYGFDVTSIYSWYQSGWIKAVLDKPRGRLLNEGDIAVARRLADMTGHIPGRAVFPAKPRSGRPKKKR